MWSCWSISNERFNYCDDILGLTNYITIKQKNLCVYIKGEDGCVRSAQAETDKKDKCTKLSSDPAACDGGSNIDITEDD